ncbi:MAG: hypothetical protein ABIK19_03490 [candidate division WOR-3 bacterium]
MLITVTLKKQVRINPLATLFILNILSILRLKVGIEIKTVVSGKGKPITSSRDKPIDVVAKLLKIKSYNLISKVSARF